MAQLVRDNFNKSIPIEIKIKDDQGYAPETILKLDSSKLESLGWQPKYDLCQMFERLICYMT